MVGLRSRRLHLRAALAHNHEASNIKVRLTIEKARKCGAVLHRYAARRFDARSRAIFADKLKRSYLRRYDDMTISQYTQTITLMAGHVPLPREWILLRGVVRPLLPDRDGKTPYEHTCVAKYHPIKYQFLRKNYEYFYSKISDRFD